MSLLKNPIKLPRVTELTRQPVLKFILKRSGPFDGTATLTRDRVYIVPTKAGLIFALLLLILLIGSINYEKSLGFILTFLLSGTGIVILLSTWRNIAGLELKSTQTPSVFAGDTAIFKVQLINHNLLDRFAIAISQHGIEYDLVNCPSNTIRLITFKAQTHTRGKFNPGRFRLYTEFPTGLFIAWTWIDLSMSCIVYPAPDKHTRPDNFYNSDRGDNDLPGDGMENFSHLRKYHHGDNISRISWKAAAKTDELFSKEFIGAKPVTHWINWDDITAHDNEHRLSIMAALIIDAESKHLHYGLKLEKKQIPPGTGNKHLHQCLTLLAMH